MVKKLRVPFWAHAKICPIACEWALNRSFIFLRLQLFGTGIPQTYSLFFILRRIILHLGSSKGPSTLSENAIQS